MPFTPVETGNVSKGVKLGANFVPDVTKWSLNPKSENQAYASSDTAGWKKRLAGQKDMSGSFECKCSDSTRLETICKPGATYAAELYYDQTLKHAGSLIVDDIAYEVDIDGGAIVAATVNFSCAGAWTDFNP